MLDIKFIDLSQHSQYISFIDETLKKLHMSEYQRIIQNLEHVSREELALNLYRIPIHFMQMDRKAQKQKQDAEYIQHLKENDRKELRQYVKNLAMGGAGSDDDDNDDDDSSEDSDGFDLLT